LEKSGAQQTDFSLAIDRCQVRMGKTEAGVTGRLHGIAAQPTLDLQVKGEGVALDHLIESAYAFGFGPPPGTRASGLATIDLRATGESSTISLNGKLGIRDLRFQNASMPQPLTVSELALHCDPERIAAAPFHASLSRTTVELNRLEIASYTRQPRAHLEISTGNAQLDDLVKIAESFGARIGLAAASGAASLQASIDTNLGAATREMKISGTGKVSNARLQMSQVAKPVEVANADLSFTGDSLRISNLGVQSGASQASGWLQISNFDQPLLSFDLKSSQIHLPELQQLMASGAGGQATSPGAASIRADGQIAIGKLVMDALTATDVQAKLTMANRLLTLAPMSLKLYDGAYQGALTLATSSGDIALRGNFNGLDINQFLSASGQKSSIYGRASGSLDVRGRSGNSQEATAQSLAGNGAIAISDGQFTSFDLMKQVEVLGKSFNLPTGGAGTAFRSLKTNLVFERGRMRTDTLQIVMNDLQVSGNGAIQLGEAPAVAYELLARLSPELTKRVLPQSSAGAGKLLASLEKISSTLGNFFLDQNSMVIPIKVSGPIKQPSFGLNTVVLERQAKTRLTERFVESLNKNKESGKQDSKETDQDQAKPKPADLLKNVIEGLGRKKKKPPE
jgi:hypothetical protein